MGPDGPEVKGVMAQPLTTFTVFGNLPVELRREIWKESFTGRRVFLWRAGSRPQVDSQTRRLLYVCREAAEVYRENYTPCFYQRGGAIPVKPLLLNLKLDTLCFQAGLKSMRRLLRQYPEDMSKIQRAEVIADLRETRWLFEHGDRPLENLTGLKDLRPLTMRSEFAHNLLSEHSRFFRPWLFNIAVNLIRSCLMRSKASDNASDCPKITAIFPSTEHYPEYMSLTTGKDLDHASYGTLTWNGIPPPEHRALLFEETKASIIKYRHTNQGNPQNSSCTRSQSSNYPDIDDWQAIRLKSLKNITYTELDDFKVTWIERDELWAPDLGQNILTRMQYARARHTRQSARDFWDIATSPFGKHCVKTLAYSEYSALDNAEREAFKNYVKRLMDAVCKGVDVEKRIVTEDYPQHWYTLPFVLKAIQVFETAGNIWVANLRYSLELAICLYLREIPWVSEDESAHRLLTMSKTIPQENETTTLHW